MQRYVQMVACSLCKATTPFAINPELPTQPRAVCLPCRYRLAAQAGLALEGHLPEGRFPLGSVHWGRASLRALTGPQARDLLARHGQGDFGEVGRLDDPRCAEADQPSAWLLLTDRLMQNALALHTGQGDVQSVFRVPLGEKGYRGIVSFTVATCPAAGLTFLFSTELAGDARI